MAGIGHNQGPTMEAGESWRRHAWSKARAQLLPTLPIEVVRLRVKRAAELGLDYRTYASVRAASGHDVIAFLFSSNALRLLGTQPALPEDRRVKLAAIAGAERGGVAHRPLSPEGLMDLAPDLLEFAAAAPRPFAGWGEARGQLLAALRERRLPADRVIMVGDTGEERGWAQAARLGYYLSAERYFAA